MYLLLLFKKRPPVKGSVAGHLQRSPGFRRATRESGKSGSLALAAEADQRRLVQKSIHLFGGAAIRQCRKTHSGRASWG